MRLKTLSLLFLFCVGCGNQTPEFVSHVQEKATAGKYWMLPAKEGTATKRVLMIHGLTKTHVTFYEDAPAFLVDHFWRTGWEVVFIDLEHTTDDAPYTALREILTPSYRDHFKAKVDAVMAACDADTGIKSLEIIGGISWGGLHTLMAASFETRFQGYFGIIPVTDITALSTFENNGVSDFSPQNEIQTLTTKKGFITYGGQDQAVNPAMVGQFVRALQNAGAPLTVQFFPGFKHETNNIMMKPLIKWVDSWVS